MGAELPNLSPLICVIWRLLKIPMALKHTPIDPEAFLTYLRSKIKGQDPVLKDLAISLQALESAQPPGRPMASFLFVGPFGVGKSALAKATADFLFEGRSSYFTGVELNVPWSKGQLIGWPAGGLGSEKGGTLTQPVLENPRHLFCIEEIQRAHPVASPGGGTVERVGER